MGAERGDARDGGLERRRVLGLLGLVGTAPLWLAGAGVADELPKPVGAAPAAGTAAADAGPSADAVGLAALARRRYGAYLDDDRTQELTSRIDGNLKSSEQLRKVKLANADEPDFTFRAEP